MSELLPSHLPDLDKFFPGSNSTGPSSDYPSQIDQVVTPMGEAITGQATDQPQEEDPSAQLPTKVEEKAPDAPKQFESIAEAIKRSREEREARTAAETREKELKSKLEARSSEPAFMKDPFGYIKTHKLSPQEQVDLGRALIYDIVPDKAPPDMRFKLYESRMAREKAEEARVAEEQKAEEQKAATIAANQASFNNFVETMAQTSKSLDPAKYPQLADWFGDDTDTLTRSMISTGTNLASAAAAAGTRADISPGALLASLETEVARRLKARDERVALRTKPAPNKASGQLSTGKTLSTSGMNTGSPQSRAVTEAERIARAIEAGFKR